MSVPKGVQVGVKPGIPGAQVGCTVAEPFRVVNADVTVAVAACFCESCLS